MLLGQKEKHLHKKNIKDENKKNHGTCEKDIEVRDSEKIVNWTCSFYR